MRFTENELDSVVSFLYSAAREFDGSAAIMRTARQPRLVEQFERQAKQARDYAGRIENRGHLGMTTWELQGVA